MAKEKYSWVKEGVAYTVVHTENKVKTMIAITDEADKADFITKACNQFSNSLINTTTNEQ